MASGYVCKNARRALLLFGLTLAGGLSLLSPCPASAQDITTGLVGRWTMDEGSGATLSDSSGSGNNGTWSDSDDNNITGETVAGQISNALTFDGSNDYVDVGSTTILDNVTEASVCFWMYYIPASVTTDGAVIGEYNGSTQDGWFFWVDDAAAATGHTNTMSWSPDTHNGGTWQPGRVEGSTDLVTPGQWDHYCGTFSGGNYIRLYKNGVLDAENTTSIVAEVPTSIQTLRMGSISTGGRYLNARLDDVRVYARALTDTDVLALYAYGVSDTTTGLVGHWTFDDGSGTTAADTSGNGNDGTLVNTPTWTTGRIGGALDFDYTSSQYVDMGLPAELQLTNTGSVSAWVRYNDQSVSGSWTYIAGATNASTDRNGYALVVWPANRPSIAVDSATAHNQFSAPLTYDDGSWHLVTGTWDGSDVILYIDGLEVGSTAQTLNANVIYNINVGRDSANTNAYFNGTIDDVRIYNRALSAADVAALYTGMGAQCSNPSGMAGEITYNTDLNVLQYCNGGSWVAVGPTIALDDGIIHHWTLDEDPAGGTYADSAGSADCTITGLPGTSSGMIGNAGTFTDGNNASCGIIADYGGLTQLTFSAWLKRTNVGSIISTGSQADPDDMISLTFWNTGGNAFFSVCGPAGGYDEGAYALNDTNWHLMTLVYDGTLTGNANRLKGYVDGQQVTLSITGTIPATLPAPTQPFLIGDYSPSDSENGSIDDVRIYDRTLSPSEINALYAMGSSSYSAPSATLAGHWTLDETSGASLADSSGNGNTGTWTDNDDNDVTGETVAGMDGTAINFDGVDDIVNAGNNASLQITGDQTWAAWIYADSFNPGGTDDIFIAKSTTTGSGLAYQFKATEDCGGQHLGIQITSDGIYGPTAATQCSATTLVTNTWYHLAAVYSASGPSLHVYVNGVLDDGGTRGSTIPSAIHDSAAPVTLGATANSAFIFDGIIDDARIYSSALGPNEIYSLYCATGGTCPGSTTSCTGPDGLAGEIVFNTDYDVMQYCNGSAWIAMGPPGDGGAACASPAGLAGELRYDADSSVLIYCEGDDWVVVNGHVP